MLKINKKISAYNHYNYNTVSYIVVHDVGARSTAKNNVDYFSGGNRNASAHYFVDDTSIWQSVEDNKGAWHVGDGNARYGITNTNSIGIEMCLPSGTVTAKTEANTVDLVKYLMKKYNVPVNRVVRHYDASRKNCPAQFNLDGKWTRWNNFKKKLTVSVSKPSTPSNNSGWKKENGTFVLNTSINLRQSASSNGKLIATLKSGDRVKYDQFKVDNNGYVWIRQKRGNSYGYLATGQSKNGKRINYWGKFY